MPTSPRRPLPAAPSLLVRRGRCPHRPAVFASYSGRGSAVRPYNRLPYLRLILALSFRASDRCHWRGNPFPAPAGAESLPPSAREVARSAGRRDVDPPHSRCSSVGGDAHAVERSGTSTLGVHRPVCRGSAAASSKRGVPRPARGSFAPGGKSTQKRRSNLRFENPCAPSPVAYLARFSHANAVPCKFHLNTALSLLL